MDSPLKVLALGLLLATSTSMAHATPLAGPLRTDAGSTSIARSTPPGAENTFASYHLGESDSDGIGNMSARLDSAPFPSHSGIGQTQGGTSVPPGPDIDNATGTGIFSSPVTYPAPEPSTLLLLGTGLVCAAIVLMRRRPRRPAKPQP